MLIHFKALPGPGARLTRTLSLASHLHNRVLRRRLSLFEDEEDDIEGDYDEVVPSPVGRGAYCIGAACLPVFLPA